MPSNAAATREEQSKFLSTWAIKHSVRFIHGKAKYFVSNELWSVWDKRYDALSEFFHVKKLAWWMAAPMTTRLYIPEHLQLAIDHEGHLSIQFSFF